ncbi:MAG: hypothetical protein K0S79_1040 [Nitrospira sp.]|nr:hypothetical protein [Nitrospira sp.]
MEGEESVQGYRSCRYGERKGHVQSGVYNSEI